MDSDNDQADSEVTSTGKKLDSMITEEAAVRNFEEAGTLVLEKSDTISIEKHADIMDSSKTAVLDSVLQDLTLPYDLSDFQKLSINTLLQKKDLVLLSPTGSGKEIYFIYWYKILKAEQLQYIMLYTNMLDNET